MTMTNEEIVRDYHQAANKSKQIKVLAELNCVSPSEIRQILAGAGVEGVKAPARIAPRRTAPPETARELEAGGRRPPERSFGGHRPENDARQEPQEPEEPQCTSVYDRIEMILASLPDKPSNDVAVHTQNLLQALFADYLDQRINRRTRNGT